MSFAILRNAILASAASFVGPLDEYSTDLAAAYCVRRLLSSYSGNAMRVRRSSDDAEQDIGFDTAGNLDTAALLTFVGAGNGFVVTLYDQSGNTRNVSQTTKTMQPQIVASGSVLTDAYGQVAIKAVGTSRMGPVAFTLDQPGSCLFCAQVRPIEVPVNLST